MSSSVVFTLSLRDTIVARYPSFSDAQSDLDRCVDAGIASRESYRIDTHILADQTISVGDIAYTPGTVEGGGFDGGNFEEPRAVWVPVEVLAFTDGVYYGREVYGDHRIWALKPEMLRKL